MPVSHHRLLLVLRAPGRIDNMADTEDMEVAVPAEDVEGAEADDKGPEFEPPQVTWVGDGGSTSSP